MLAILVPSRGFVFTQVDELIDKLYERFDIRVFRTYDKPIPDAHNFLVQKGLESGAEFLFFLEEDVVPTPEQVLGIVNRNTDIAFIDYGVNGWSCSAKTTKGEILWAGVGCTLIHRRVFEKLEKPWFRTDKVLRLNDWQWLDNPSKYGGQDIWFYTKAREAGFKIEQVPGEARHLKLKELGKPDVNNGLHLIFDKKKIINYQIIKEGGVSK